MNWFDGPNPEEAGYPLKSAAWAFLWIGVPFLVLVLCYDLLLGHFCGHPLPPWGLVAAGIVGVGHLLYLVLLFRCIYSDRTTP